MDADLLNKYLWTVKKQAIAFISSILLLEMISPLGLAEDALPKGKDYPAVIYHGKTATSVDRTDEFTNMFHTRFKEALQMRVSMPRPNGAAAVLGVMLLLLSTSEQGARYPTPFRSIIAGRTKSRSL